MSKVYVFLPFVAGCIVLYPSCASALRVVGERADAETGGPSPEDLGGKLSTAERYLKAEAQCLGVFSLVNSHLRGFHAGHLERLMSKAVSW